jgi:hypothetical protein
MRRKNHKQPFPKAPAVIPAIGALKAGAACRYLSISNSTLKRLEQRGMLRPVRFIRERRYLVAQLDALLTRSLNVMLKETGRC